jgi:hypothetical protein
VTDEAKPILDTREITAAFENDLLNENPEKKHAPE